MVAEQSDKLPKTSTPTMRCVAMCQAFSIDKPITLLGGSYD